MMAENKRVESIGSCFDVSVLNNKFNNMHQYINFGYGGFFDNYSKITSCYNFDIIRVIIVTYIKVYKVQVIQTPNAIWGDAHV